MRVVCVDARPAREGAIWFSRLVKGRIYTVNKADNFHWSEEGIVKSFWLEEVKRNENIPYGAWRFRPIDESRLDQFRVHLNPKKVEEKVDA